MDGAWSAWGEVGSCTVTCGNSGTITSTRSCTNPELACGGRDCTGNDTQSDPCNRDVDCPLVCTYGSMIFSEGERVTNHPMDSDCKHWLVTVSVLYILPIVV